MGKKGRIAGSSPSTSSSTKSKKHAGSGSNTRLEDSPIAPSSQDEWAIRETLKSKVARMNISNVNTSKAVSGSAYSAEGNVLVLDKGDTSMGNPSSGDAIHGPNAVSPSAIKVAGTLVSNIEGPDTLISQHPGPIDDNKVNNDMQGTDVKLSKGGNQDNISSTQFEGNEDWEASPIALQFSSLLDSNELRKRNLVAAQPMGGQLGGPNINLLNALNGQEEFALKTGNVVTQPKLGFDPKNQSIAQSEVLDGRELLGENQTRHNGTIDHLMLRPALSAGHVESTCPAQNEDHVAKSGGRGQILAVGLEQQLPGLRANVGMAFNAQTHSAHYAAHHHLASQRNHVAPSAVASATHCPEPINGSDTLQATCHLKNQPDSYSMIPTRHAGGSVTTGEYIPESHFKNVGLSTDSLGLGSKRIIGPLEKINSKQGGTQPDQRGPSWASILQPKAAADVKLKYTKHARTEERIKISIPDHLTNEGSKAWDFTLVGYFLGRKLPYSLVKHSSSRLWDKAGLCDMYRSEERRVGKECSEPCRSRWSPYH